MDHRFLGRTGTKVSEVGLGAMTFGREADEATSHRMLDLFAEREIPEYDPVLPQQIAVTHLVTEIEIEFAARDLSPGKRDRA